MKTNLIHLQILDRISTINKIFKSLENSTFRDLYTKTFNELFHIKKDMRFGYTKSFI